jgi:hypothetical protein
MGATGLREDQAQLSCVGSAVPIPDWDLFRRDPSAVPSTCAGDATPHPRSGRAPNVTLFGDEFAAPRSWRASLGFQRRLAQTLGITLDATYARGTSLFGVRDLNLNATPGFRLDAEGGRPIYVGPDAIVPATGEAAFFASRIHPQFGNVFEVHSDLRSRTLQGTVSIAGILPWQRIFFQTSYTASRSRDQSSFSGGSTFGGFAGSPTAGDPNDAVWATSDFERRHGVLATVGSQLRPWVDLALIGRFMAGSPFTPLVGGDINGDGARNDQAFVFDPATADDPALAEQMLRLLRTAPGRVRDCLGAQLGEIAGRNSCRGPRTQSIDLRVNFRPEVPGVGRRFTLSVDGLNLPAGLDQLVHGRDGVRGWGQGGRPDAVLLYPRGFDPVARRYVYEVNERFGQSRQGGPGGFRSPFQIQIQGRMQVGPAPPQSFGGMGGGRGGMRGGGVMMGIPGGGSGPGGAFDVTQLLDRVLVNPIRSILALGDTLSLTPDQVARLKPLADSLQVELDALRTRVGEQQPGAGRDPMTAFRELQPALDAVRRAREAALREVESLLTPEQWARVPQEVRSSPRRVRPGGGRPGG